MVNTNFFFLILIICLLLLSGGGADHAEYLRWAEYFYTFDIGVFDKLNKHGLGLHKSENGLPLTVWSYGSGIFTAFINKIFFFIKKDIPIEISTLLVSTLNLLLLSKILDQKKIQKLNKLFLICIFILFFPGGFYINKESSETWTIFLTLFSIFLIEDRNKKNFFVNLFIIGICFYFLLLVKIPNIFICIFLFINLIVNNIKNQKINKIFSKKIIYICFLIFFFLLPIILISIYQKIVFDAFFTNAYSFGDESISSFSIKNFKLNEILFSTWHGLFFYHPFYVIINFYLIYFLFKNKLDSKIYILTLIHFFLIISQILIQSSWSFWWMGTGTYGSRGFSGVSTVTFYIFVYMINKYQNIKINNILIFASIILLIWNTFLFYFGETNFVNFDSFINKIIRPHSIILLIKILLIILFFLLLKIIYKLNNLYFLKLTLISLTFFVFFSNIYSNFKINGVIVVIIFCLLSYFIIKSSILFDFTNNKLREIIRTFLNISFIALFFTSLFFQYNLFINFNNSKNINYSNGANFNCIDLRQTLDEYKYIEGYDIDKQLWEKFFLKKCSNVLN